MSGVYDAMMMREHGQQQVRGSYTGTAVPPVGGIHYGSYGQPDAWADPTVHGKDLMVRMDALRQVASQIGALAAQLQGAIGNWHPPAATAGQGSVVGQWREALWLAHVIGQASAAFSLAAAQLRQAHDDTAAKITMSVDNYEATEQNLTAAARAAGSGGTIVRSGGSTVPVDPAAGMTPRQREAYAVTQRLISMNGGTGDNWTASYPVTSGTTMPQGSTAGYTWQQVEQMIGATDPGAILAAAAAYGNLYQQLTDVANQLTRHGRTLAQNWQGSTAVTAVSQLSQLYSTAADMQANAWTVQQALHYYGSVLTAFKSSPSPRPAPASSTQQAAANEAAANQAAQQRLAALNRAVATAYNTMPAQVNVNLPPSPKTSGKSTAPGYQASSVGASGRSSGGVFAGGSGSPGGTGAGGGALPGVLMAPGGGTPPGGSLPPSSQLAGAGPGALSQVGGGLPGTTAGGAFGSVPATAAGSPGSTFALVPGAGAGGAVPGRGMPPGESEVPAEGAVAGESGPAPAAQEAVSGRIPVTASSGAGGDGVGRLRQSWDAEDEATWEPGAGAAGDAAEAGEGLFMPVGPGGGRNREKDRRRQAWLAEEVDLWGPGEPAVPPVIGG